jgi:hypothetical protein
MATPKPITYVKSAVQLAQHIYGSNHTTMNGGANIELDGKPAAIVNKKLSVRNCTNCTFEEVTDPEGMTMTTKFIDPARPNKRIKIIKDVDTPQAVEALEADIREAARSLLPVASKFTVLQAKKGMDMYLVTYIHALFSPRTLTGTYVASHYDKPTGASAKVEVSLREGVFRTKFEGLTDEEKTNLVLGDSDWLQQLIANASVRWSVNDCAVHENFVPLSDCKAYGGELMFPLTPEHMPSVTIVQKEGVKLEPQVYKAALGEDLLHELNEGTVDTSLASGKPLPVSAEVVLRCIENAKKPSDIAIKAKDIMLVSNMYTVKLKGSISTKFSSPGALATHCMNLPEKGLQFAVYQNGKLKYAKRPAIANRVQLVGTDCLLGHNGATQGLSVIPEKTDGTNSGTGTGTSSGSGSGSGSGSESSSSSGSGSEEEPLGSDIDGALESFL